MAISVRSLQPTRERNALSARLVNEPIFAIETAGEDADVWVIVLAGAGGAFCAGADLSLMGGGADEDDDIPHGGFVERNLALRDAHIPIIAKVERYAMAGASPHLRQHFVVAEDTAIRRA